MANISSESSNSAFNSFVKDIFSDDGTSDAFSGSSVAEVSDIEVSTSGNVGVNFNNRDVTVDASQTASAQMSLSDTSKLKVSDTSSVSLGEDTQKLTNTLKASLEQNLGNDTTHTISAESVNELAFKDSKAVLSTKGSVSETYKYNGGSYSQSVNAGLSLDEKGVSMSSGFKQSETVGTDYNNTTYSNSVDASVSSDGTPSVKASQSVSTVSGTEENNIRTDNSANMSMGLDGSSSASYKSGYNVHSGGTDVGGNTTVSSSETSEGKETQSVSNESHCNTQIADGVKVNNSVEAKHSETTTEKGASEETDEMKFNHSIDVDPQKAGMATAVAAAVYNAVASTVTSAISEATKTTTSTANTGTQESESNDNAENETQSVNAENAAGEDVDLDYNYDYGYGF